MAGESHPIRERPEDSPERRIQLLEIHLAQLWDQVWWMNLSEEQREQYEQEGFAAPIQKFYDRGS